MVDLTHYLWACQHPCPWSRRPDHPLFLRASVRSCLYLPSYADRRSDGSIHGDLNRLPSLSSQAIPRVMERNWHRTGTGIAALLRHLLFTGFLFDELTGHGPHLGHTRQPLAIPHLESFCLSAPGLFTQRVGDGTAAGTAVLVRLLFHGVERCGGRLASKCSICVALWSPHQPLALHPLGSLFSSSPCLFAQRLCGRVRHWLHPMAHLSTGAKLCGIPPCIWTCSRLPAPVGGSPELSLHRGGICLRERGCRQHLPLHVMEGRCAAHPYIGSRWTGAPADRNRPPSSPAPDRPHQPHTKRKVAGRC